MRRQAQTEWKYLHNTYLNKGVVSKVHKQLIKLNGKRKENPILKWEEDLNRHLRKKRYTDGK